MNALSYILVIFAAIILSVGWVIIFLAWMAVGFITIVITVKGLRKLTQARK